MQRLHGTSHRLMLVAIASVMLAGCAGNPATLSVKRGIATPKTGSPNVGSHLVPLPTHVPAFVSTTGGGTLNGTVAFQAVSDTFFGNNAANYRVQSAMPSANALVTLSTLGEDLYTKDGNAITVTAGSDGKFTLKSLAPTDKPFVAVADLVQSHRLTAIVPKGATTVSVDEASSMITEMARWQLREAPVTNNPDPSEKSLVDLSAALMTTLYTDTLAVLNPADFASHGAVPNIDALKIGSGHLLRNLYVAAFGSKVTRDGTTPSDDLSDKWTSLLGFRPLALTRAAGNGSLGFNASDGKPATEVSLTTPIDAVTDLAGNMYVTQQDAHLISFIPSSAATNLDLSSAFLAWDNTGGRTLPMKAGNIHTILGDINGPNNLDDYNGYVNATQSQADGSLPTRGFLFAPYKLALVQSDATKHPDLIFTSKFGRRVMFVPGATQTIYGRTFQADKIYVLAGSGAPEYNASAYNLGAPVENGTAPDYGDGIGTSRYPYNIGDGGPAYAANLSSVTGLARDDAGDLFVVDSEPRQTLMDYASTDPLASSTAPSQNGRNFMVYHGALRIIRPSDGAIFSLHVTVDMGAGPVPLLLNSANDIRIDPDKQFLYVADGGDDVVFRVPLPSAAAIAAWTNNPPAYQLNPATDVVLGNPGKAGYIDTDSPVSALYPEIFDISDGIDVSKILLNNPTSIAFDKDKNLVVADSGNGRIRLLKGGKLYTIAGGLDTTYLSGDSRLCFFPGLTYLNLESQDAQAQNMLVCDRKENVVRRLWTAKGAL